MLKGENMKHMSLKLSHNQHANLQMIADEYGMTKTQVAIVCIDLGCQSIAAVGNLPTKETAKLSQAFSSVLEKMNLPEVPDQNLEVEKPSK